MIFIVTYRGKDGALREEAVEATDRAGCVAECRKRGISPTKIAEGGKGKGRDKRGTSRVGAAGDNKRTTARWVAVAALGVAVIAGGMWWWIGSHGATAPVTEKPAKHKVEKPKAEKPVRPAAKPETVSVATNVPAKPERVTAKGTRIPDNVKPDEFGVLRYPGGLRWVDTNDLHVVKHPHKKRLFKHHSENSIATILTLDPSKMAPFLVGRRPRFGQRFVDDFKASLYEEVEFPEDDTEEEREVRKAVVAVKKEMAEALKRGEDIAKMMNDAQDELDRLVSYRDSIMKQLKEINQDEKYTDQNVADFTAAANEMLKSQGLQELRTPNLTYRQMMLQRRRERMNADSESNGVGEKQPDAGNQK